MVSLDITKEELEKLPTSELKKLREEYRRLTAIFNNKQLAAKVNLNSAYGVLANVWCRWYDFLLAEGVTLSGQVSLKWVERKINEYMNKLLKTHDIDYVLYEDTDSVYVALGPLVDIAFKGKNPTPNEVTDFLDKFIETKLQKVIDEAYVHLAKAMNCAQQKMNMKREAIADGAVFLKKKRYMMNVIDNEGVRYAEPKLKVMGTEAVRSTTPVVCKDAIKKATKIMFAEGEEQVVAFNEKFREEYAALPVEKMARPSGMSDLDSYIDRFGNLKKGAPIHVKSAYNYNTLIDKMGLGEKYEKIKNGDKIKYINLKTPNKYKMDSIAFLNVFPPEFKITKSMMDIEEMFEKTYLGSMRTTLETIGWKCEDGMNLSGLFG